MQGKFDDDYPIASAFKDIVNIRQAVSSVEADTPLIDAMSAIYEKTLSGGFGADAKSSMIKIFEKQMNVKVRKP